MGRKLGLDNDKSRQLGLSYAPNKTYLIDKTYLSLSAVPFSDKLPDNIRGEDLIEGINKIAVRERIPRSEITLRALAVYWACHKEGNFQTLVTSYAAGGVKSSIQVEADILSQLSKLREVRWIDLMHILIKKDIDPKNRVAMGERIFSKLIENGVKVWR